MSALAARPPVGAWLELGLSRIPGRYGVGLVPWLVSLLFSIGGASVPTAGPYEAQWVRAAVLISLCAALAQGIAVLLVRPWARRLPPTVAGGLASLGVFALLGAVGGTVGAIGFALVDLPDRPAFFLPTTVFAMAVTTWVCVGAIVAISFSWRDHLRDSLAAAAARVEAKQAALRHSLDLDGRRRAVAVRALDQRVIPELERLLAALARPAGDDAGDPGRALVAERIEHVARVEIRGISHLLHPEGAPDDLTAALANVARLRDADVELRVHHDAVQTIVPADALCEAAVLLDEALTALDAAAPDPRPVVDARRSATAIALRVEHAAGTRELELPLAPPPATAPAAVAAPKWYRVAPAPCGMPWVAIAVINAFSVLVATVAAGTGQWAAAAADIAVITIGTFGLDLLLRRPAVRRLSVRGQWVLIGAYIGALGALAGAVWGTALGGETASLALMGLICAFGMGMFLPARRVWSTETRRLRQELQLAELGVETETVTMRALARERCATAASMLHSLVQSRLLGIAGSVGDQTPADLRAAALAALGELVEETLPGISADLAADAAPAAQPLLTEEMLKSTWPAARLHVTATEALPEPLVPLVNTLIVEAIGNAIAHGSADEVSVTATVWPGAVELTVDDNGTGVKPHAQRGLGLSTIAAAASDCSLTSRAAGGARLHVRVPYVA
jgi:hypothetical protein